MTFAVTASRFLQRACALGTLALVLSSAAPALAGPIPFGQAEVSITARELSLSEAIQAIAARAGVPVVVSPSVRAVITGKFIGPAEREFRRLMNEYNLVPYYDGAVLYVYTATEVVTRSIALSPAATARVQREAVQLQLPDERNVLRTTKEGSLVLNGTLRFVEQIDELARRHGSGGAPAQPTGFQTFYLRYAWAQDLTINIGGRQVIVPGVASLLRSLVGLSPREGVVGLRERTQRPSQPSLRGQGLAGQGTLGWSDEPASYGQVDTPAARVARASGTAPELGGGKGPQIVADVRLNAIIVQDSPERLASYAQLVASLDVEPQMIEIEATIIDFNTSRLQELGINWRYVNGTREILFGRGDASDIRLRPNTDITPSGRGLFLSGVIGNGSQFIARVNALATDGAAKVVSRPQVVTLSNVEAVFFDNTQFFVKVPGFQDVDLFNVTAGTTLRVTPHAFREGDQTIIKVLVNIEDGRVTGQVVDGVPIVSQSGLNTQSLIREGESILIGGLTRDNSESTTDKVPLLGDVPLLGWLFKNRSKTDSHIERLFMITPRLSSPTARAGKGRSIEDRFQTPPPPTPPATSDSSEVQFTRARQAPPRPPAPMQATPSPAAPGQAMSSQSVPSQTPQGFVPGALSNNPGRSARDPSFGLDRP